MLQTVSFVAFALRSLSHRRKTLCSKFEFFKPCDRVYARRLPELPAMRSESFGLSSWVPPALAFALLPCAILLGKTCGLTPGAASLVLMLVPISLALKSANSRGIFVTTILASAAALAEGWRVLLESPHTILSQSLVGQTFPMLAAGMLFASQSLLRPATTPDGESKRTELDRPDSVPTSLENQPAIQATDDFAPTSEFNPKSELPVDELVPAVSVAELLEQSDQNTLPASATSPQELQPGHASPEPVAAGSESDDPQLLLTLQEVGWRVATDFDLATLYQTVRHTTQRILRCQRCCVMLWNHLDSTLSDALPPDDPDVAPSRWANRGMLGWVTKNRQLLVRVDVESDPALGYLQRRDESHIDAIAPLVAGGELLGVLTLEGANATAPQFRRMLQLLANVSALAIKNARLFQRIAEMARRDGLTGLFNHASFQERLRELVDLAQCENQPLCVIMCDVDKFKSINDTHGHPTGDQVLREVGRIWRTVVPENAVAARYGGEEFICAIPGMPLSRASELADALRHTIETLPVSFEGRVISVTASFGVAELGTPARNATELVRLADEALYQSKRDGRNRVTLVSPTARKLGQPVVTH